MFASPRVLPVPLLILSPFLGIIDIGSGLKGTLQGHEYSSRRVESLVVGLASAKDGVFVLRNTTAGDVLLCVECIIPSNSSEDTPLEGRETLEYSIDGIPLTESTMLCGGDGQHLFFVESLVLYICEPTLKVVARSGTTRAEIRLLRTVPLRPPDEELADLLPISPANWNLVCNGYYLSAICSDVSDDDLSFISLSWDMSSGSLVESREWVNSKSVIGRTCCYDPYSNSVRFCCLLVFSPLTDHFAFWQIDLDLLFVWV